MDTILICFIFLCIISWFYSYLLTKENKEVVLLNEERQQENEKIEESIKQKQNELSSLDAEAGNKKQVIKERNDTIKLLEQTEKELRKGAQNRANEYYEECLEKKKKELEENYGVIVQSYLNKIADITVKCDEAFAELKSLEDKKTAYIKAQQRQLEMEANRDYYRMALSEIDIDDISLLRKIQHKFVKKEAIDKLIWEVYYKSAYDALMARILPGSHKICGIYKMTDLTTDLAYIGQSVNIGR